MTSRLDRLLLLLDTGSSTSVRNTAAKQLAQIAAKSVVAIEQDTKSTRQHAALGDPSSWSELMAVVARILPYLHSRSHDTRTAASYALSQIFTLVPFWQPQNGTEVKKEGADKLTTPDFPAFSVRDLVNKGRLLLASSGREFTRPTGILLSSVEVKKASKEAMGRLGLDFLDNVGDDSMDIEKELATEDSLDVDVDMEMADSPTDVSKSAKPEESRSVTPATTTNAPSPSSSTNEDMNALSARERNRLKRKRKGGTGSAFVHAPPPPQSASSKYSAAPAGPNKARLVSNEEQGQSSRLDNAGGSTPSNGNTNDKVIIDPTKGGAVSPKVAQQSKALEVRQGTWIWDGVTKILEVDLFSEAWEVRHGAAMALRELLKAQGQCGGMHDQLSPAENAIAHEKWCNDLAAKFLCVFVLDRFVDFVSDQAVAPVRETVSQTLAALLLHMPRRSVLHVHGILLQMICQNFSSAPTVLARPKRNSETSHIWQIRHAGLLGVKYEVAVRSDMFEQSAIDHAEEDEDGKSILRGVVDAAVLGLGDGDDDVRAVAASCLLPIASHIVSQVPDCLEKILLVVSECLRDMKDDLSSSVGTVMDLLGDLVKYDKVIEILGDDKVAMPLSMLIPILYPFFRHTIPRVRLAVVTTLSSFMAVETLPKSWIDSSCLRLIYQNLVLEERTEVRNATLAAWRSALSIVSSKDGWIESIAPQALVLEWFAMAMTPLGVPLDTQIFFHPTLGNEQDVPLERHNVDRNMKRQDLALLSVDIVLKARIAAAEALALLIVIWPNTTMENMFRHIIKHYFSSMSMLQKFLAAIISEEWAHEYDRRHSKSTEPQLVETSEMAKEIASIVLTWLQGSPPSAYHEMSFTLAHLHIECQNLLQSFAMDCRLPVSSIPFLGTDYDITDTKAGCFTITTANQAVGHMFNQLRDSLGRTRKKELAVIMEKRAKIATMIERYGEVTTEHDNRISAAFAATFVAFRSMPDKVSPVVKGIMNGIKNEENLDLQTRSAIAVAAFVGFCVKKGLGQPADKIVKNLCTFLCQDTEQTPAFSFTSSVEAGILSFHAMSKSSVQNGKSALGEKELVAQHTAQLSRRGASLAFKQLSIHFGSDLLDAVPKMWQSMAGGLLSAFTSDDPEANDELIANSYGQDVIDSLSVLDAVVPTFNEQLWPKIMDIFPSIALAMRSKYAIIRQIAARCFSTICDVITVDAMHFVIEKIIPLLADPLVLYNRQGATELIFHVIQKLDIKALPYVIFLIVPILGRMSDADEDIRSVATNTFASLVKMVPLEAGLPDPPGFSEDMIERRENERQFLTQLLDGSKVEQYDLPVPIKAELRKYQQDGVNWLAFLAKYQLHGILCDDMGLGKTLQSICILSAKHFERKQRFEETKSSDSVHLPSLIVCPPTLTGHWYYEILKYSENLVPVMYTGNARERIKRSTTLIQHDIVITSYDIVRNDINFLKDINWLYVILDEGHVIKNARTKLTKAVKSMRSQHRLILSGTPVQNNVLELWSLFDFLMPGFLGTESSFNERFSKPILANRDGKSKNGEAAALALEALHKQLLPFLLRRLKEDVLHDLPPKIIQDYYCELSELQKFLYDDFSQSSARSSAEGVIQSDDQSQKGGQTHVFQALQYLRKLCNHPALVLKKDPQAIEAALSHVSARGDGLHDMQHAPKLLALRQLLNDCGIGTGSSGVDLSKTELLDTDSDSSGSTLSQHRVLIFCQMKQMLDIIETDLFKHHMPTVTYMRLDGSTDTAKRHAVVQTFNSDPSIDCLLLTTHVGGLGLTLTGADTVIFVEHDWNPMKDLQAMDRAHRIGQKKVVNVYRLIAKGTLEEKIMGLQRFKLNIANSVVTQQNSGLSSMDTDLVLDLFKRTSEEEDTAIAKRKAKESSGPSSQKNALQGLEDLPAEDEYDSLDLSSFMSSLGK